jgi:hypothetical protein
MQSSKTSVAADTPPPVMAAGDWSTNGDLIADVARIGYIRGTDRVLDMTYGLGGWWTEYQPPLLVACDIDPAKSRMGSVDFTELPLAWESQFDVVAFDPPYKLNGTPDPAIDARYGVHMPTTIPGRHGLMCTGLQEAARVVVNRGVVLAKCQDQVASGKVWWQSDMLTAVGAEVGLTKIDELLMPSYRAQPPGRRQIHARRNYSTLLVFRKEA